MTRQERMRLLDAAQSLLYVHGRAPKEQHRTCWCHRAVVAMGGKVKVMRRTDGSRARLTAIQRCMSVWTCPVCSVAVSEVRRDELTRGIAHWGAEGRPVYLLTLTIPHQYGEGLALLLAPFRKALKRFKQSKAYRAIPRQGSVRSMEVTWSARNGWHPHTHELLFCEPGALGDVREGEGGRLSSGAIDTLKRAWIDAMRREGLAATSSEADLWAHALDVRGGLYAAEYVAKYGREGDWSMASELTRAHAKVGARSITGTLDHYTPFQILAWAAGGDDTAATIFREFAAAFEDVRMLYWSPGLRARVGLAEDADAALVQAVEQPKPDEQHVASIDAEALALVVSRRARADMLDFVSEHCGGELAQARLDAWIRDLAQRPRRTSGEVLARYDYGPPDRIKAAA